MAFGQIPATEQNILRIGNYYYRDRLRWLCFTVQLQQLLGNRNPLIASADRLRAAQ